MDETIGRINSILSERRDSEIVVLLKQIQESLNKVIILLTEIRGEYGNDPEGL